MKILKFFDFPKSDLTLLINGKPNIKISLGGILNIFIIAVAIAFFQIFSNDMIKKENPNIFTENIMDEDRIIKINQSTINIIIQPFFSASGQNFPDIDFSIFTIKGLNPSYFTFENGTKKLF